MVMMLLCDHDSSLDSSSSKDNDLERLMLHLMEKPKRILGPSRNVEDLFSLVCKQQFRSVLAMLV